MPAFNELNEYAHPVLKAITPFQDISDAEIHSYVSLRRISVTTGMNQLIDALGKWKNGCIQ
jgi:hypothetical protein